MTGSKHDGIEARRVLGKNTQVLNSSRPQAGHRPLDPRWKEPRFPGSPLEGTPVPRVPARRNPGSSLEGTPVPRYEVLRVRSPEPPPSPGKMENFR
ncbi:hypothetical protein F2Q69_00005350 [Brassica cretica]|uniref:Uncharacterized protein n=1 Tax=Brassica cretica TaxID=69181 RepID=A0A8S9NSA6_BRACR|nr:hypothetical protein F2Q69_00005350 [Brassica cretica]